MKWFKHISDSLDDPFVDEILDEFGDFGYLAFFGILETYAREFKTTKQWFLSVRLEYLRRKFHKKSVKPLRNFLASNLLAKKWLVKLNDKRVDIFIPKFTEIIDETTQKKLRNIELKFENNSGSVPEWFETKDKTKTKTKTKTNPPAEKTAGHYSNKIGDDLVGKIETACEMVVTFGGKKGMNPYAFVQICANHNGHPSAILAALNAVVDNYQKKRGFKTGPFALAKHVFGIENGNHNEADFRETAEKLKTIKPPKALAELIGKIGG